MNTAINNHRFAKAKEVKLTDGFWKDFYDKIKTVTLPDVFNKFEREKNFENFSDFTAKNGAAHHGYPFHDGLIYETIRAASDILGDEYDEELDKRLDGYIKLISDAQAVDPDGYINTYTARVMPDKRFGTNGGTIWWQHDMYNSGALFEAGVHHYLATGKTSLLSCAVKLANYEAKIIGNAPKMNIVPGHSIAEEALIKLYRLLKDEPQLANVLGADVDGYLELASFWIYNRGNHKNRAAYPRSMMQYAQDSTPILIEDEAVGHAVRATLFYEGAAALVAENGDEALKEASLRIWNNVYETKMHVTGGVGSVPTDESFGTQYQIMNDAYLETCAGVGLAFWAGYMYLITGDGRMMDIFERSLCNNVLVGVSKEGNKYFYQNPLFSGGDIERWEWHNCPCCPPMLLKLISALKTYIYSVSGETLNVNMYINSKYTHTNIKLEQKDGIITVKKAEGEITSLRIRIPEYSGKYAVVCNGKTVTASPVNGYVTVALANGENRIEVKLETPVERLVGHPYINVGSDITGVQGKVAVRRGPFIYCAEGIDNDGDVTFVLASDAKFSYNPDDMSISAVRADGKSCKLIPYFDWNNRGKGLMRVWINQDNMPALAPAGWEGKLYRTYEELNG